MPGDLPCSTTDTIRRPDSLIKNSVFLPMYLYGNSALNAAKNGRYTGLHRSCVSVQGFSPENEKTLSKNCYHFIETNFFRSKIILIFINLSCIYVKINFNSKKLNLISTELIFIIIKPSFIFYNLILKYTKSNYNIDELILTFIK